MTAPINRWQLAVDFGTSNTAAAHVGRAGVETLPLSHHGNLMPSAVFVESSGTVLAGEVAVHRGQAEPVQLIPAPKRHVGQGTVRVGTGEVADHALVAAVLRAVIERAAVIHNGARPDRLVLRDPPTCRPPDTS